MGDTFYDFAYDFFNNLPRFGVPLYTGNLIDSMNLGVFYKQTAIGLVNHTQIAVEKQHWGGKWKGKGFGVDFRQIGLGEFFEDDNDLMNNPSYAVILHCGIPYGNYLERGYKSRRGANHAGWFHILGLWMRNELQGRMAGRLKSMGEKVSVFDYEMASGLVTTDIF